MGYASEVCHVGELPASVYILLCFYPLEAVGHLFCSPGPYAQPHLSSDDACFRGNSVCPKTCPGRSRGASEQHVVTVRAAMGFVGRGGMQFVADVPET